MIIIIIIIIMDCFFIYSFTIDDNLRTILFSINIMNNNNNNNNDG